MKRGDAGSAGSAVLRVLGGLVVAAAIVVGLQLVSQSGQDSEAIGTFGESGTTATSATDTTPVTTAVTTSPTTTSPATTSTVEAETTTTTTTTALPPATVGAKAALLRYDGDSGVGTIEAAVCNVGPDQADGLVVTIAAPASTVVVDAPASLPAGSCAGFFDADTDLAAFGIIEPGVFAVTVEVDGGGVASSSGFDVVVEEITVAPDPEQHAAYQRCLTSEDADACEDHVRYQPVAGEVMKRDREFQSIAPAEVEVLATVSVLEMRNCLPRIEEFLGITGPRPVSHRRVVGEYSGSYASPYVNWTSSGPIEDHRRLVENSGSWRLWQTVIGDRCGWVTAHELTHLILGDAPMPALLNEGLATWMEAASRSNAWEQPGDVDVQCRDDAWFGWDWDLEEDAWVPYSNLLTPDPDAPGIYLYFTGMCFWDYLETTYGTESVLAIVQETASRRDPRFNGCSVFVESVYFIRDIVNPILGIDITPVTEERWGFGETFTNCEGLY